MTEYVTLSVTVLHVHKCVNDKILTENHYENEKRCDQRKFYMNFHLLHKINSHSDSDSAPVVSLTMLLRLINCCFSIIIIIITTTVRT